MTHSAENDVPYVDALQRQIRDLRTVLETLHEQEPWVPRDEFKQAFTENCLGQLYEDMFGERVFPPGSGDTDQAEEG